jgi:type I restriction enzyme S subunit
MTNRGMDAQMFLAEFGAIASAPNGVQKLREMVLHFAFSGKLLPAVTEWEKSPLKTLSTKIGSGSTPKGGREFYEAKGVPLIRSMNVHFKGFEPAGLVYLNDAQAQALASSTVQTNDVLLNITGASIGRVAVAPAVMNGARVNQHVMIIRLIPELDSRFLSLYLASPLIQGLIDDIQIGATREALTKGMIERFDVPLPPLAEQRRIVAKVDELMGLCDRLEALQTQRKNQRAVLTQELLGRLSQGDADDVQTCLQNFSHLVTDADQVPEIRKAILSLAVQGKLVEQDAGDGDIEEELAGITKIREEYESKLGMRSTRQTDLGSQEENLFAIPPQWRWTQLREVALYIQRGKGPKYADRGSVRVVSQKCVQWKGFDASVTRWIDDGTVEEYAHERFLQPGDLLWNSTGTGTAGRIGIYPEGIEGQSVADSHVTIIRLARVDSRYLWCHIASPGVQARIVPTHPQALVSGTTNQVELATGSVRTLPIPLPPLAEQKRIVAKVDALMVLCDTLEAKLRKASEVQELLAQTTIAALTGIQTQEKETMKAPKTELVARLKLGKKPSIKDQAPLAALLVRNKGELSPNALHQHSSLSIDEFYHQLKFEMSQGWIVQPETPTMRVVVRR